MPTSHNSKSVYHSTYTKIPGRSYSDIERAARAIHKEIQRGTKRTPHIRSAYFSNEKVFVDVYWTHLNQKPRGDRKRRLKLYEAAIDLIRHSKMPPEIKANPNGKNETVYRFTGEAKEGELFYVQIKEDARGRKYFMSAFSPR